MNDAINALAPCPFCKKPPGQKVGPPAMARCITDGREGKSLGAETLQEWNTRALHAADALSPATEVRREATIGAICAYRQKVSSGSVHSSATGDRIYYAGLSIPELADAILLALPCADEAAIRADEREKCAKIADLSVIADRSYALEYPDEAHKFDQRAHRGTTIAQAIRNGGKQP